MFIIFRFQMRMTHLFRHMISFYWGTYIHMYDILYSTVLAAPTRVFGASIFNLHPHATWLPFGSPPFRRCASPSREVGPPNGVYVWGADLHIATDIYICMYITHICMWCCSTRITISRDANRRRFVQICCCQRQVGCTQSEIKNK